MNKPVITGTKPDGTTFAFESNVSDEAWAKEVARQRKNRLARERRAIQRVAKTIVKYNLTEEQMEKAVLLAIQTKVGL